MSLGQNDRPDLDRQMSPRDVTSSVLNNAYNSISCSCIHQIKGGEIDIYSANSAGKQKDNSLFSYMTPRWPSGGATAVEAE